MSKRQREAHEEKSANRVRVFPELSLVELQSRLELMEHAGALIGEYMNLALTKGLIPEQQSHMFGANMTIGMYVTHRMMDMYAREIAIEKRGLDIVRAASGLIGPDGSPLARN